VRIRPYAEGDAPDCHEVMYQAVHRGAAATYSAEERAAWAPPGPMPPDWPDRLARQITRVAIRDARLGGFLTLGRDGHLDLFYVLPEEMGRGTAAQLYEAAEEAARGLGLAWMTTGASWLARSFLLRRGWQHVARQSVIRAGVPLTNFRMEKCIAPSAVPVRGASHPAPGA